MKRLIICFDGTWNTPDKGANPTNVVKMVRAIPACDTGSGKSIPQITFYDKGVGTGGPLDKLWGGATGDGLMGNVVDGYRFLANNYEAGDEIYFFGFSRGAYTARVCAGLVGRIGLLSPLDLGGNLIESIRILSLPDYMNSQKPLLLKDLKYTAHKNVPVKCVGVWDTVGSLGIPGDWGKTLARHKYQFEDVTLGSFVEFGLHAIAIDEKRASFPPTIWVYEKGKPKPEDQTIEQVWFSGVHSNIGGSMADMGLSDTTFDWMVKRVQAHQCGLTFDASYLTQAVAPNFKGRGYESRTIMYADSKVMPYYRLMNQSKIPSRGIGGLFRDTFEDFDRRNLIDQEKFETAHEFLHISALHRWREDAVLHDVSKKSKKTRLYRPPNLKAVIKGRTMDVVDSTGTILAKAGDMDVEGVWPELDPED